MKLVAASMLALVLALLLVSAPALAWGPKGHQLVCQLAFAQLDDKARAQLTALVGELDAKKADDSCNWADEVRDTEAYSHSRPWHYINMPRWTDHYDRSRDCPGGDCVTERIPYFASRLADERLDEQQRIEAFRFLGHFVGDIHQPFHNGFADDRGANEVEVAYRGREENLHWLWDGALISVLRTGLGRDYYGDLLANSDSPPGSCWKPSEAPAWTEEGRRLIDRQRLYPPGPDITSKYEQRAIVLIDQQLVLAGQRLARILNATLGEGEVVVE